MMAPKPLLPLLLVGFSACSSNKRPSAKSTDECAALATQLLKCHGKNLHRTERTEAHKTIREMCLAQVATHEAVLKCLKLADDQAVYRCANRAFNHELADRGEIHRQAVVRLLREKVKPETRVDKCAAYPDCSKLTSCLLRVGKASPDARLSNYLRRLFGSPNDALAGSGRRNRGPMGPSKFNNQHHKDMIGPQGPTPGQVFKQATAHIKGKKWKAALRLLKQLQAHNPSSTVYENNATFVENNIKGEEILQKAKKAIGAGKLVLAERRINDDFLKDKRFFDKGVCKIHLDACKKARRLGRKVRFMKAAPLVFAARKLAKSETKRSEALAKVNEALRIAPDAYLAQKLRHELGGPPPTARPEPELDRLMASETQ